MCKKLIYLFCFVVVASVAMTSAADAALPNLIGWWKFDGDTLDSSGLGNDGKAEGDPKFVPGQIGMAIDLDGNDYVVLDPVADDVVRNSSNSDITISLWLKTTDNDAELVACNTSGRGNVARLCIDNSKFAIDDSAPEGHSTTSIDDNQWHFLAYIRRGGTGYIHVDAVQENSVAAVFNYSATDLWSIGQEWDSGGPSGFINPGTVDDVQIYDRALAQEELEQVMVGVPAGAASNPKPPHEEIDVPRDVVLSWTPGEFAPPVNGHKIYLSENFNDVNDGVGGIAQDANSYAPPQRLELSTTYYWRVDEVNGAPDYTVYPGSVWSFTTELLAYPIENVTATASSQAPNRGVENTVNGSGLDDSGLLHGKQGDNTMWLSDMAGAQPTWIQFEFDKVYKLHELLVWNSNDSLEAVIGFGFKDVTIEYSDNGTDYTTLGITHEFAQATGMPDYAYNTTIDMESVPAKYVRLTANSNWGGILPQFGLSEVRFLHIPVQARKPYPDSGATGVPPDVVLGWVAGREAVTHDVYVSADEQAVIDGTAPVATVTEASHGPLALDLGVAHYWKVNEVNEAETPSTWESAIWSFTTTDHLVVDDFESYNDLDPGDPLSKRIFNVWLDGFGIATNGSVVGYEMPPFCEQTIVHGGKQSMPLAYSNTAGAAYSEAELTLTPAQDWTAAGVKTLAVHFYGAGGNSGQLYVKINGTKVPYDGQASNLALTGWQAWNIDLASSGASLQNVTKLAIGIDGNGASGTLFVDDIGLYPYERQFVTPVEPDPANLAGHWQLDGNLNDSSGNSRHGTSMGGPTFAPGKISQAISLDGVDDYVTITGYKGIAADRTDPDNPVQRPFSVACWINTTDVAGRGSLVNWGSSDSAPVGGQYQNFHVHEGRLRAEHGNGRFRGATTVSDGQWHHVAMVVSEGANIEPPRTQLYVDGLKDTEGADTVNAQNIWNVTEEADVAIGIRASHVDRFFNGMIDDARIYDRALTEEEVAWLAGRTDPFDKPF